MTGLALTPANDDERPRALSDDLVAAHLAARRIQRRATTMVALMTAGLVAATLFYGYDVGRIDTDLVTFAFRV